MGCEDVFVAHFVIQSSSYSYTNKQKTSLCTTQIHFIWIFACDTTQFNATPCRLVFIFWIIYFLFSFCSTQTELNQMKWLFWISVFYSHISRWCSTLIAATETKQLVVIVLFLKYWHQLHKPKWMRFFCCSRFWKSFRKIVAI